MAGYERIDYRVTMAVPRYPCILGADLLYEQKIGEPLSRWIASALLPGGIAVLSDPNRAAANGFSHCASEVGLTVSVKAVESTTPKGQIKRGRIWRLTR